MYTKLNDTQKQWVLSLTGKELYSKTLELKNKEKIDNETMKQMFSFWLNEHNLRHDQPYMEIRTVEPDKNGYSKHFVKNEIEPKLYWENYDEDISIQKIKNEFEVIWNARV
jgi:hypothetical protein